jgi:hypothetical protein
LPEFRKNKCEVCGKEVNPLDDYRDLITDKIYSPREYVEYQLNMSEEEKQERQRFFTDLFAQHNHELVQEVEMN